MSGSSKYFAAIGISLLALTSIAYTQQRPQNQPSASDNSPEAVAQKIEKRLKHQQEADAFFQGPVIFLEIKIPKKQWDYLNIDPRRYAECTLTETAPDGSKTVYKNVAIKLKGGMGSTQSLDQKPGLTLNFDKLKGAHRFHGMEKLHLNNAAQDPTFLNEYIGGEIARSGEVPASRCHHVLVSINQRTPELYVLKEAFTKDFTDFFFSETKGDIYEAGRPLQDLDMPDVFERSKGDSPFRQAIQTLITACQQPDEPAKWEQIGQLVDVEGFLRMLAMESMLCHWDGYNFNRNNYRIYFNPKNGRMHFILHGMDRLFMGSTEWGIQREPMSLLGRAIWSNPAWKTQQLQIAKDAFSKITARDWQAKITAQGQKVITALEKQSPDKAREFETQMQETIHKTTTRLKEIEQELKNIPSSPGQDRTEK